MEIAWGEAWTRAGDMLREHHVRGLEHLITEDVVRFAVVQALVERGVPAGDIRAEWRPSTGVAIDLAVGDPVTAAIEFKYPREPVETNAAWTQHLGELMKDFFRLASLPSSVEQRWCVQVVSTRLQRYLGGVATNYGVSLALRAGEWTRLDARSIGAVPATARKSLERWSASELVVAARCMRSDELAPGLAVLVHDVRAEADRR